MEFPKEEVEQSIPERFDQVVKLCPRRIAIKTTTAGITFVSIADGGGNGNGDRRDSGEDDEQRRNRADVERGGSHVRRRSGAMRRRCGGAKRDSGAQAVIVEKDTMRQHGGWITKECKVNDMSDVGPSPSEENPTNSYRHGLLSRVLYS